MKKEISEEERLEQLSCIELYQTQLACVGFKTTQEAINEGVADWQGGLYMCEGMIIYPDGTVTHNE